jgi:eukaryotic-like serine/threonine-protein kinase
MAASDPPFGLRAIPSELHRGVVFHIEKRLGEGGTAVAYLARRESPLGTSPAVLKIVQTDPAAGSQTAALVVQKEAVALGRLNERVPPTPFVVRLLEVGTVRVPNLRGHIDLPWLAIEYVHGGLEGTTLDERLEFSLRRTGYAFDPERVARMITHLCEGLAEVHEAQVIHRDIKPNNILCCGFAEDEIFKLSDFGIARPVGVEATFGAAVLGTPGYVAPEQSFSDLGGLGPHSDVFSLGALVYFALTGEHYFKAGTPVQTMMAARSAERRSIVDVPALCPELKAKREACQGIDQALARATAAEPKQRTPTARAFAASLIPWLSSPESSLSSSRRRIDTLNKIRVPKEIAGWSWTVRYPPGSERVVSSVGWDADAHCLASTMRGLAYWDGTSWTDATFSELPAPGEVGFVRRIGVGRWLVGGGRATLAEYSRAGVTRVMQAPDPKVTFVDASGSIDDLAVIVGTRTGDAPLLWAIAAGRWVKPLPVVNAAFVAGIARLDDLSWLLVGRHVAGGSFAAVYRPLDWTLDPIEVPNSRALLACASRSERELALAVGASGVSLHIESGRIAYERIDSGADLSTAALDVLGRQWAGAAGQLWMNPGAGAKWSCVWQDAAWRAPFVGLFADAGLVVAVAADGAVLECHAGPGAVVRG